MKRYLPYIIAFVIILVVALAVTTILLSRKKETGPVVLRYLGMWDPDVINPLKDEYQKNNPNTIIEYEQKDPDQYFSYLTKALATANGPDLFWIHNGWMPVLKNNLAALPQTILKNSDYEKTFYPITKDDLLFEGSYRGIPLEIDGLALYYNKDLLQTKGFTSPPKDLDSLTTMAALLTSYDDQAKIRIGGVALGATNNIDFFPDILGMLMLQNKVNFVSAGVNTLAANNTLDGRNLAADALSVYLKFLKTDKVWGTLLPNSLEAFATGKAAMVFLPAESLPDLTKLITSKNLKLNYGVAPAPQVVQSDPVSWGRYWINSVNTTSKNQTEAWKFAKFLSEQASLRKIFNLEIKVNGFGQPYPRKDMATELASDPFLGAYVIQAPIAKSWYLHSQTGDDLLNGKIIDAFTKRVSEAGESSEQIGTVAAIAKDIQPILAKYGLASSIAK